MTRQSITLLIIIHNVEKNLHSSTANVMIVSKYINEKGKIMPRRMTGACAKHQRHISEQINYARLMALIPFVK